VRSGWPLNPVTFALLVLGAFLGALALSALLAHPAGASTLPGTSGAPTVGAASNVVHPAVAAVDALTDVEAPHSATAGSDSTTGPDAAARPAVSPVVSPVVTLLPVVTALPVVTVWQGPGSALQGLAPVMEPISQATAPPLGLVVTTLTSVPTRVADTALPFSQPAAPSGVEPVINTTTGFPGGPPALGLRAGPGVPDPAPPPAPVPAWPLQSFPLAPNGSPTGDSSLSCAGAALMAAPASGPLLPDPPVSGVIPAQNGIPRFLFDLRSSPPG
jgi:hypothetical protein